MNKESCVTLRNFLFVQVTFSYLTCTEKYQLSFRENIYLNLAEHDNVGAQESLFFIYSRDQVGVGLGKKNLSEAIKWGMKAAQNGCVNVQALLANALLEGSFEGEPVEQDREKAILWLRNAAKKGYKKAMKKLAELGI